MLTTPLSSYLLSGQTATLHAHGLTATPSGCRRPHRLERNKGSRFRNRGFPARYVCAVAAESPGRGSTVATSPRFTRIQCQVPRFASQLWDVFGTRKTAVSKSGKARIAREVASCGEKAQGSVSEGDYESPALTN